MFIIYIKDSLFIKYDVATYVNIPTTICIRRINTEDMNEVTRIYN